MPHLAGKAPTQRVELPGYAPDDPAWVELRDTTMGDVVAAAENTGNDADRVVFMVTRCIENWNFTDAEEKPLPVTVENVRMLTPAAFLTIVRRLGLDQIDTLDVGKKKP